MTYFESIEKYLKEEYTGTDNTCNGKCSKCGECCGIVLPIDQEDANRIQEYVFKNKILINRYLLVMTRKLQCPYYNGNKEKGCSIYEARPKICRYYKCNRRFIDIKEAESMLDCMPVDMWAFAEDVEKEMKRHYGLNKKTRKAIKQSI